MPPKPRDPNGSERRRGKGEGTITKRPDGRWMAQMDNGNDPLTGKRKCITYYGKTQTEVRKQINQAKLEQQQGTFVEPTRTSLGEWLAKWLAAYARPSIRESTHDNYSLFITKHIIPSSGQRFSETCNPSRFKSFTARN